MTLEDLNRLDATTFAQVLGDIYEHSPWVAARAHAARPFASLDALAREMAQIVAGASPIEQRTLIEAHPDLGGRLARAGGLAEHSRTEQAGLGLDRLSDDDYQRLDRLNHAYRDRFHIPFIVAVRRHTLGSLLETWERRLANDLATEHRTALEEIDAIARLRLHRFVAVDN